MKLARGVAVVLATWLMAACPALGANPGTALKADEIKAEPFRDA